MNSYLPNERADWLMEGHNIAIYEIPGICGNQEFYED